MKKSVLFETKNEHIVILRGLLLLTPSRLFEVYELAVGLVRNAEEADLNRPIDDCLSDLIGRLDDFLGRENKHPSDLCVQAYKQSHVRVWRSAKRDDQPNRRELIDVLEVTNGSALFFLDVRQRLSGQLKLLIFTSTPRKVCRQCEASQGERKFAEETFGA
ncbi:MAG: hypothetical protein JSS54_03085 [Proteobacteria bacterium]|nr:hypothetical protein [Pseudomonadota bacterium]